MPDHITNPTNPQTPPENFQPNPPSPASDPERIVSTLMSALESRQQRLERSVTRDMAAQYGMTEEELTTLLNNHRAEKAKQLPPEAQKQLDAANARVQALLLKGEVSRLGAAMGLVDADAALALMDRAAIKTEGETITGVQEALDKLKTGKPYLFGAQPQQAWGQRQGSGTDNDPEAAFRRALGLDTKK